MFKIIIYFLKKYLGDEKFRIIVYSVLKESVVKDYSEQTPFGNVYNANIEFLMGDDLFNKLITENDSDSLRTLKSGLGNSFYTAAQYVENDLKRRNKLSF